MILKTVADWYKAIPRINWKCLAFDIETDGLDVFTMQWDGFSLYDGNLGVYMDLTDIKDPKSIIESLFSYLMAANNVLIGHNLVFDLKGLAGQVGIDRLNEYLVKVRLMDTFLGDYLLDERLPSHKLKGPGGCCERYLGRDAMTYEDAHAFGVDSPEFAAYAIADVVNAWDIMAEEMKQIREQDLEFVFQVENWFLPVQIEMEWHGVLIDIDLLKQLECKLDIRKCELQDKIIDCLGDEIVPQKYLFGIPAEALGLDSPQKVGKLLKKKFGIDSPNADKYVLEEHIGEHPFFELMLRYRSVSKLLSTYVSAYWKLLDDNNIVHPNFHIVSTGRTSCSKPNLQNQEKDNKWYDDVNIRKLIIPRPGNKFLKIDVSAQEMRLAASHSLDKNMITAFEQGWDIHLFVANRSLALGIPEEKLVNTHPEFEATKEQYDEERTGFKAVNFGILYGKTVWGFSKDLGITTWEAKKLINGFYDTFRNIEGAIAYWKEFQKANGYVVAETGRRRRFDHPMTEHDFRAGFNHLEQGEAATQKKKMAGDLWRYYQKFNEKPRIRLDIHDELIIEAPADKIELLIEPSEKIMVNAIKYHCPMAVESEVVDSYGGNYD